MRQENKKEWCEMDAGIINKSDLHKEMDTFLALDRTVLEFSMRVYNVSRRDKEIIRKQNRRLHAAVRQQFPKLTGTSRKSF